MTHGINKVGFQKQTVAILVLLPWQACIVCLSFSIPSALHAYTHIQSYTEQINDMEEHENE